jgi:cyclophilin family peptidyl-prolyl cis-trans isomerase
LSLASVDDSPLIPFFDTCRYGNGPHKVKFTFEQDDSSGSDRLTPQNRFFVVELASVEEMPISVHFFLELVSNKIWDDTIFIHHEKRDHVIAVPPISFTTQRTKSEEINALGWARLGYPEYSERYPHKKYTLGFANQGPTFYINTMDNSINHGPNGQEHHLLPGEADPCFGVVVDGFDAIDELVEFGSLQAKQKSNRHGDQTSSLFGTAKDDPAWTHLVKVEVL